MGVPKGQPKGVLNNRSIDPLYFLTAAMVRQCMADVIYHQTRCREDAPIKDCPFEVETAVAFLFGGGALEMFKDCQIDIDDAAFVEEVERVIRTGRAPVV